MKQPRQIGDLLAYSIMIINASSEYEDTPWLQHDAGFGREASGHKSEHTLGSDWCIFVDYMLCNGTIQAPMQGLLRNRPRIMAVNRD